MPTDNPTPPTPPDHDDEPRYVTCPICHTDEDVVVVTYAYHSVMDTERFGLQLEHYDWSDAYAVWCEHCGASTGNRHCPDLVMSLDTAIAMMRRPNQPDPETPNED